MIHDPFFSITNHLSSLLHLLLIDITAQSKHHHVYPDSHRCKLSVTRCISPTSITEHTSSACRFAIVLVSEPRRRWTSLLASWRRTASRKHHLHGSGFCSTSYLSNTGLSQVPIRSMKPKSALETRDGRPTPRSSKISRPRQSPWACGICFSPRVIIRNPLASPTLSMD